MDVYRCRAWAGSSAQLLQAWIQGASWMVSKAVLYVIEASWASVVLDTFWKEKWSWGLLCVWVILNFDVTNWRTSTLRVVKIFFYTYKLLIIHFSQTLKVGVIHTYHQWSGHWKKWWWASSCSDPVYIHFHIFQPSILKPSFPIVSLVSYSCILFAFHSTSCRITCLGHASSVAIFASRYGLIQPVT